MNFVNLTPHELNIIVDDDETINIESTGEVARVDQSTEQSDPLDGIPVQLVEMQEIINLPEPEAGTVFIVSGIVEANTNRADIYSPGPLVRDDDGKPVGCEGLKQTV